MRPACPETLGFVCQRAEPRVNEQGAVDVCSAVIARLNASGDSYSEPVVPSGPESGVDCIAESSIGTLRFQVTRACHDQELWRYLAIHKGVLAYRSRLEIANDLWQAVTFKASRIPVYDRTSITLVLDATDLMAHVDEQAVMLFLGKYGADLYDFQFASVWLAEGFGIHVYQLA